MYCAKGVFMNVNLQRFNSRLISQLRLSLNRRYIAGCISYMLLKVTVNTTAECLRTDCNCLGDTIKKKVAYTRKN